MANLPTGYTELEYIESTGGQYINTAVSVKSKSGFYVKFSVMSASGTNGVIGGFTYGGYNNNFAAYSGQWITQYGNNQGYQFGTVDTFTHEIEQNIEAGVVKFDGSIIQSGLSYYDNADKSFNLFCYNGGPSYPTFWIGKSKIYSCKIYYSGSILRDYIPCKNSSGEVGLYDLISSSFFGNAGTGSFLAGPEVVVGPGAPSGFAYSVSGDTITLSWDAVSDSDGYRVYKNGALVSKQAETSFSTSVEFFTGAQYAVSAYNESGESEKSTLSVYLKPENPIPYLITDRTQADVTKKAEKGFYNTSDLNRVTSCMEYLDEELRKLGYESGCVFDWKIWVESDAPTASQMIQYLTNVESIRSVFTLPEDAPQTPESMALLTFAKANDIERVLQYVENTIQHTINGMARSNSFAFWSGNRPFPTVYSNKGRNWAELDAMETGWRNWQLATWYLLLYGNLKAEGDVV